MPDRSWALNVLSTICPEHEFFTKGFRPLKKRRADVSSEDEISDEDEFFQDLP